MLTALDNKTIDELMKAYVEALKAGLGDNLKTVVLFGSCARGEQKIGSDVDVFILLEEETKEAKEIIRTVSNKLSWDYDTMLLDIVKTVKMFNYYKIETLHQNVIREGKIYYGAI